MVEASVQALDQAVRLLRTDDPAWEGRLAGHLRAAKTRLLMGEWAAAAEEAQRALALDPKNPEAALVLAEVAARQGDARRAAALALLAREQMPGDADAGLLLARALYKTGDYAGALEAAQAADKAKPGHSETLRALAAIHDALGNRRDALRALERAAAANPALAALLERARAGGKIGYPEFEELADADDPVPVRRTRAGLWLLGGLGVCGALGLSLLRRRRKAGQAPALSRTPGEALGFGAKYEAVRVLARTGSGELLEARDRRLERPVSVLRVRAGGDAARKERILREARVAATLRHPAILDLYEALEDGSDVCLVFESLRGRTAEEMLREAGRLPLAQVLFVLEPVCEALELAHARGVAHRGLRPSALLLTEHGSVKVTGFGAEAPAPGAAEDGRRGDLHDLGVCLYELATGSKPFADGDAVDGRAGLALVPPSKRVPGLPPALDALVADSLAPAPEPRIRSAKQFLDRLKGLLDSRKPVNG